MRFYAKYLLLGLALTGLLCRADVVLAQSDGPTLEISGRSKNGFIFDKRTGKKTVRLRVFLRVWQSEAMEQEFKGSLSLNDVYNRLYCNDKDKPANIFQGPKRVADAANPVPMVFLLAIDVSGSMGSASENGQRRYQRRMKPLEQALDGFVGDINNPAVFLRLYPWGHFAPFSVEVEGARQQLNLWEGRYLPLDDEGRESLLQGVNDIGLFVREGDRNVNTALYGVCLRGAEELRNALASDQRFRGAKAALVVLTDGENDPTLARPEVRELTLPRVKSELGRAEPPIPVYTIAFGLDNAEARRALQEISQVSSGGFSEVADGVDAAKELQRVYLNLVEYEGNAWWIDIDTRMTERQLAVDGIDVQIRGLPITAVNDRMLLVPSALVDLSPKHIGLSLAIAFLILLIFVNVWYFTRPKEISDTVGGLRSGVEDEETEREAARIAGVGVSQYLRRDKDEEDS